MKKDVDEFLVLRRESSARGAVLRALREPSYKKSSYKKTLAGGGKSNPGRLEKLFEL